MLFFKERKLNIFSICCSPSYKEDDQNTKQKQAHKGPLMNDVCASVETEGDCTGIAPGKFRLPRPGESVNQDHHTPLPRIVHLDGSNERHFELCEDRSEIVCCLRFFCFLSSRAVGIMRLGVPSIFRNDWLGAIQPAQKAIEARV